MATRSGFAVLEAVVALTIVGLATVGAVGAIASHGRAADRAVAALEADALADERLARLHLLGRDELTHLPDSLAEGDFGPAWPGYGWEASVRPDRGTSPLLHVRIVVTGPLREHVIETRFYRPRLPAGALRSGP